MQKYLEYTENIKGWFCADEIIPVYLKINEFQKSKSIQGNLCEIGVFEGKSFIPLKLLAFPLEITLAVDIFVDNSYGNSYYKDFIDNCKAFFNNETLEKELKILKIDSTKLLPKNFIEECNNNLRFRFISIDGCHTKEATYIDLNNASQILTNYGVIVIDDYTNTEWPGVKAGVDKFLYENNNLRIFYLRFNKMILCKNQNFIEFNNLFRNSNAERIYKLSIEKQLWKN